MEPPFNQMDKIIDGLYLGNIEAASNMVLLKKKVRIYRRLTDIGDHSHPTGRCWLPTFLPRGKRFSL